MEHCTKAICRLVFLLLYVWVDNSVWGGGRIVLVKNIYFIEGRILMFDMTILLLSQVDGEQESCYYGSNSYSCTEGCGVGCTSAGGAGGNQGVYVCNGNLAQ